MSQWTRVLALSKRFNGVCAAELLSDPPDGGAPITRLAARIQNLEDRQHVFEILPDRKGTRTYRWVEGPCEAERSDGASSPAPPAREDSLVSVASLGPESVEPRPTAHYLQDVV